MREFYLLVSLALFLFNSYLYERKLKIFGPGYIIYFFVVFLIHNVSSYAYTGNYGNLGWFARYPENHYLLYFIIYIIINLIILIYLLYSGSYKKESIKLNFSIKKNESLSILFISLYFLLPVQYLIGGEIKKLLITSCTYFFITVIYFKLYKKSGLYIVGFIFSIIIVYFLLDWRFIALQYLLPFGIAIVILHSINKQKSFKLNFKSTLYILIALYGVIVYGVVSEMFKLGQVNGLNSITNVLFNFDAFTYWVERQLFRIFQIWIILGGNIVEYTDANGMFYGITYIKSLAPYLGFEYISIPKISADLAGANYAQPGLVAEGYANFGIIGAVINVLSVFFLAEFLQRRFLKKQTMLNLMLLCTPFSSVLIDGGTFNSALFNIMFCLITFAFTFIFKSYRKNRNSLYSYSS
jgi:hypothetical protein